MSVKDASTKGKNEKISKRNKNWHKGELKGKEITTNTYQECARNDASR